MTTRNNKTEKISYQSGRTKITAENPGKETYRIIRMVNNYKTIWLVLLLVVPTALYILANLLNIHPQMFPAILQNLIPSG